MKQTAKKGQGATSKRSMVVKPLTKAQQELVENHIPFAMNMGKKFAGLGRFKGVPMEDLQQQACYGLCIAAQRFDCSKALHSKHTPMTGARSLSLRLSTDNHFPFLKIKMWRMLMFLMPRIELQQRKSEF